jgi:regulator of protease activity HflC (stomatin/prohibitin superfamily)
MMADIHSRPLIRHLRGAPTTYVRHLRRGRTAHEGVGISFWFRPLSAVISEVPVDDRELPMLFHARTADFQDVTVQATVTYRISSPEMAAQRIDFAIHPDTGQWRSAPLDQVASMLTEIAQQHARTVLAGLELRESIIGGPSAVLQEVGAGLAGDARLTDTGITVVGVRVVAIRPEPDVERALQTPARERVQQDADRATFERRALAVESERAIAENEMQSQIELAHREENLVAQRGQNERRRAEEAAVAGRIEAESTAELERLLAAARADAVRLAGTSEADVRRLAGTSEADVRRLAGAAEADMRRLTGAADAEVRRVAGAADADVRRLAGAAEAEALAAQLAAYQNVDPAMVLALAASALAGQLPQIGTLNLSPDLITTALGRLTASAPQ